MALGNKISLKYFPNKSGNSGPKYSKCFLGLFMTRDEANWDVPEDKWTKLKIRGELPNGGLKAQYTVS